MREMAAKRASGELRLVGAGGEPVGLRRTLASHGVADLPPNRIDEEAWTLELTLPLDRKAPRTVRVSAGRKGYAKLDVLGRAPAKADLEELKSAVAHVLRLAEDLTPFYEVAAADPDLAWAAAGAGRMIRSPTVFEDVVNTSFPFARRAAARGAVVPCAVCSSRSAHPSARLRTARGAPTPRDPVGI